MAQLTLKTIKDMQQKILQQQQQQAAYVVAHQAAQNPPMSLNAIAQMYQQQIAAYRAVQQAAPGAFLDPLAGLSPAKGFLEKEGGHRENDVDIMTETNHAADCRIIRVYCAGCERQWACTISMANMKTMPFHELYKHHVGPFFRRIGKELCKNIVLETVLAEWITKTLADAEPEGLRYADMCRGAVEGFKCSIHDVQNLCQSMGFLDEWYSMSPARARMMTDETAPIEYAHIGGVLVDNPVVRLPVGHPLRKD